jgi:predicted TIM-barrel fold metal-dependent hydrolase
MARGRNAEPLGWRLTIATQEAAVRSQPLIDAHVHLYPDPAAGVRAKDRYLIWEYGDDPGVAFSASPGDLGTLASVYEKSGFDHAIVVHTFDTALAREQLAEHLGADEATGAAADMLRAANRWIARAVADEPVAEVLISIDPTVLAPQAITAHLAELAAAGVRGVKLHPVNHSFIPNDARLHPMYELCAETGLTVLSHSGLGYAGTAGSARPADFAPVLAKWPGLKLVLAHLGGASWAETAALAADFPHVVFDLSEVIEWTGASYAPATTQLSALIRRIGADRVMLGSDFPWYDPVRTADRVAGLPGLSDSERAAILGGTATRVFGLG